MAASTYAQQVRLRPDSNAADVAATIAADIERSGSVTITVRVEDRLPEAVIAAAVEASSASSDVTLYVLGYEGDDPDDDGLYGSRPKDRDLAPLRALPQLAHLVLGDPYPAREIQRLQGWFSGALSYRGVGPVDFTPRWRTPIENLDPLSGID